MGFAGHMILSDRIQSLIEFLLCSPKYGTFTESSRTDPSNLSDDTWRRELIKLNNPHLLLWEQVKPLVKPKHGYLIADDTIIDKPRGKKYNVLDFIILENINESSEAFAWCLSFGQMENELFQSILESIKNRMEFLKMSI